MFCQPARSSLAGNTLFHNASSGSVVRYTPSDSTEPLSRNSVGPVTRMKISRPIAIAMLKLDRRLMPFSRPSATEMQATVVTIAMVRTCTNGEIAMPNNSLSPALICRVPRPTEVATPNTVPMTATTSMVLPMGPKTLSPSRGAKIELTRGGILRL